MRRKINLLPRNDQTCGWINILGPRAGFPSLHGENIADWAIIGGGFTGLAFARRMAAEKPQDHIVILDAGAIGEGASARNSGFAVATSSLDMAYDPARLAEFKRVNRINKAGIDRLRTIIDDHNIDCQWCQTGKYHCGANNDTDQAANDFSHWLDAADIAYEDLSGAALKKRLGISYYPRGIRTPDDVMLQPAALARGLARSLPDNIGLFDFSPVLQIADYGGRVHLDCPNGTVIARNLILASNSFLHCMTPRSSHTVPLTLTAGLTRPLDRAEQAALGDAQDWGILSLAKMGATLRYTADHRILIRNTVDYRANAYLGGSEMQAARQQHQTCLRQRFPMLDNLSFEHSWQGSLCVSRNSTVLFGKLADRIYGAGCYNASGVARGSALGYALADHALGRESPLLDDILTYPAPKWMPPRPFLDLVMKAEIRRRKFTSGADA